MAFTRAGDQGHQWQCELARRWVRPNDPDTCKPVSADFTDPETPSWSTYCVTSEMDLFYIPDSGDSAAYAKAHATLTFMSGSDGGSFMLVVKNTQGEMLPRDSVLTYSNAAFALLAVSIVIDPKLFLLIQRQFQFAQLTALFNGARRRWGTAPVCISSLICCLALFLMFRSRLN